MYAGSNYYRIYVLTEALAEYILKPLSCLGVGWGCEFVVLVDYYQHYDLLCTRRRESGAVSLTGGYTIPSCTSTVSTQT